MMKSSTVTRAAVSSRWREGGAAAAVADRRSSFFSPSSRQGTKDMWSKKGKLGRGGGRGSGSGRQEGGRGNTDAAFINSTTKDGGGDDKAFRQQHGRHMTHLVEGLRTSLNTRNNAGPSTATQTPTQTKRGQAMTFQASPPPHPQIGRVLSGRERYVMAAAGLQARQDDAWRRQVVQEAEESLRQRLLQQAQERSPLEALLQYSDAAVEGMSRNGGEDLGPSTEAIPAVEDDVTGRIARLIRDAASPSSLSSSLSSSPFPSSSLPQEDEHERRGERGEAERTALEALLGLLLRGEAPPPLSTSSNRSSGNSSSNGGNSEVNDTIPRDRDDDLHGHLHDPRRRRLHHPLLGVVRGAAKDALLRCGTGGQARIDVEAMNAVHETAAAVVWQFAVSVVVRVTMLAATTPTASATPTHHFSEHFDVLVAGALRLGTNFYPENRKYDDSRTLGETSIDYTDRNDARPLAESNADGDADDDGSGTFWRDVVGGLEATLFGGSSPSHNNPNPAIITPPHLQERTWLAASMIAAACVRSLECSAQHAFVADDPRTSSAPSAVVASRRSAPVTTTTAGNGEDGASQEPRRQVLQALRSADTIATASGQTPRHRPRPRPSSMGNNDTLVRCRLAHNGALSATGTSTSTDRDSSSSPRMQRQEPLVNLRYNRLSMVIGLLDGLATHVQQHCVQPLPAASSSLSAGSLSAAGAATVNHALQYRLEELQLLQLACGERQHDQHLHQQQDHRHGSTTTAVLAYASFMNVWLNRLLARLLRLQWGPLLAMDQATAAAAASPTTTTVQVKEPPTVPVSGGVVADAADDDVLSPEEEAVVNELFSRCAQQEASGNRTTRSPPRLQEEAEGELGGEVSPQHPQHSAANAQPSPPHSVEGVQPQVSVQQRITGLAIGAEVLSTDLLPRVVTTILRALADLGAVVGAASERLPHHLIQQLSQQEHSGASYDDVDPHNDDDDPGAGFFDDHDHSSRPHSASSCVRLEAIRHSRSYTHVVTASNDGGGGGKRGGGSAQQQASHAFTHALASVLPMGTPALSEASAALLLAYLTHAVRSSSTPTGAGYAHDTALPVGIIGAADAASAPPRTSARSGLLACDNLPPSLVAARRAALEALASVRGRSVAGIRLRQHHFAAQAAPRSMYRDAGRRHAARKRGHNGGASQTEKDQQTTAAAASDPLDAAFVAPTHSDHRASHHRTGRASRSRSDNSNGSSLFAQQQRRLEEHTATLLRRRHQRQQQRLLRRLTQSLVTSSRVLSTLYALPPLLIVQRHRTRIVSVRDPRTGVRRKRPQPFHYYAHINWSWRALKGALVGKKKTHTNDKGHAGSDKGGDVTSAEAVAAAARRGGGGAVDAHVARLVAGSQRQRARIHLYVPPAPAVLAVLSGSAAGPSHGGSGETGAFSTEGCHVGAVRAMAFANEEEQTHRLEQLVRGGRLRSLDPRSPRLLPTPPTAAHATQKRGANISGFDRGSTAAFAAAPHAPLPLATLASVAFDAVDVGYAAEQPPPLRVGVEGKAAEEEHAGCRSTDNPGVPSLLPPAVLRVLRHESAWACGRLRQATRPYQSHRHVAPSSSSASRPSSHTLKGLGPYDPGLEPPVVVTGVAFFDGDDEAMADATILGSGSGGGSGGRGDGVVGEAMRAFAAAGRSSLQPAFPLC